MRRAVREADRAYAGKSSEPSKIYADAIRATVRDSAQKLSANKGSARQPDASRSSSPQETLLSSETAFFQKLEKAKNDPIIKRIYRGSTVADRMILDKRSAGYEERRSGYKEKFGYTPYVSQSMLVAYCMEHGIKIEFFDDSSPKEYASMLAQRQINAAGLKEPTVEIAESCIRQALCFKALHDADGSGSSGKPTPEKVAELDAKASILAEHIAKENLHVLNDKKLMREALTVIDLKAILKDGLASRDLNRMAEINGRDADMSQHRTKINRSYDLDMGR
jgi:hypothetical protein